MLIRQASPNDIFQIQIVRNSVKENMLSDPALVTDDMCHDYITRRGKGWVCEIDNRIVGFSIVSIINKNVWALFIHPDFESKGIGRRLHDEMIDWYFTQTNETVWLSTSPQTRAESFYRKAGWSHVGMYGKGELLFQMSKDEWKNLRDRKISLQST